MKLIDFVLLMETDYTNVVVCL